MYFKSVKTEDKIPASLDLKSCPELIVAQNPKVMELTRSFKITCYMPKTYGKTEESI